MASVNTKGDQSWSGLDDVSRVESPFRIEQQFDLVEGFHDLRAEHLVHHFGPDAPISMFARDGATVFDHKLRQISGQGCPLFLFDFLPKIKSGAYMQQANRRVGVPDGLALLLLQSAGKSPSECGVLLEGYGAVFKTSNGHLAGGWFPDQSQPFFPKSPEQLGFGGISWFVERDSLLSEQVFGGCGALIVIFQIDQCTIGRHLVEDGGEATLPLGRLDDVGINQFNGRRVSAHQMQQSVTRRIDICKRRQQQFGPLGCGDQLHFRALDQGQRAFRPADKRGEVDVVKGPWCACTELGQDVIQRIPRHIPPDGWVSPVNLVFDRPDNFGDFGSQLFDQRILTARSFLKP